MKKKRPENLPRRISRCILWLTLLGSVVAGILGRSPLWALSFFLGGGAFWLLFQHLRSLFGEEKGPKGAYLLTYLLRLSLIGLFFYATLLVSKTFFLGAAAGFMTATFSLTLEGLREIFLRGERDGRTESLSDGNHQQNLR